MAFFNFRKKKDEAEEKLRGFGNKISKIRIRPTAQKVNSAYKNVRNTAIKRSVPSAIRIANKARNTYKQAKSDLWSDKIKESSYAKLNGIKRSALAREKVFRNRVKTEATNMYMEPSKSIGRAGVKVVPPVADKVRIRDVVREMPGAAVGIGEEILRGGVRTAKTTGQLQRNFTPKWLPDATVKYGPIKLTTKKEKYKMPEKGQFTKPLPFGIGKVNSTLDEAAIRQYKGQSGMKVAGHFAADTFLPFLDATTGGAAGASKGALLASKGALGIPFIGGMAKADALKAARMAMEELAKKSKGLKGSRPSTQPENTFVIRDGKLYKHSNVTGKAEQTASRYSAKNSDITSQKQGSLFNQNTQVQSQPQQVRDIYRDVTNKRQVLNETHVRAMSDEELVELGYRFRGRDANVRDIADEYKEIGDYLNEEDLVYRELKRRGFGTDLETGRFTKTQPPATAQTASRSVEKNSDITKMSDEKITNLYDDLTNEIYDVGNDIKVSGTTDDLTVHHANLKEEAERVFKEIRKRGEMQRAYDDLTNEIYDVGNDIKVSGTTDEINAHYASLKEDAERVLKEIRSREEIGASRSDELINGKKVEETFDVKKPEVLSAGDVLPEEGGIDSFGTIHAPSVGKRDISWIERAWTSGGRELEGMGEGGYALNEMMTKQKILQDTIIGKYNQHLHNAVNRLSRDEKREVVDVMRGKATTENGNVQEAADRLREIYDEALKEADYAGVSPEYVENYFPIVYKNDIVKQGKRREKAIQHLIDTGQVKDVDEGAAMIDDYFTKEVAQGRSKSFEHKRSDMDLPDENRVLGLDVLERYNTQLGERMSQAAIYGKEGQFTNIQLAKIKEDGHDPARANEIVDSVMGTMDDSTYGKAVQKITEFETVMKLPTSFIKNLTQISNEVAEGGLKNTLAATYKYIAGDKAIRDLARRANVMDDRIVFQEGGVINPSKIGKYTMYLFGKTEEALRTISGGAGVLRAEQLLKKKAKGSDFNGYVQRGLDRLGMKSEYIDKDGKLNDLGKRVMARNMSEMTQFKIDAQNTPKAWRGNTGRLITQWQSFNYRQTRFMVDSILKEAGHGNFMPMARFVVSIVPLTILTTSATDWVRGRDPGEENMETREMFGPIFGLPGSVYEKGKYIADQAKNPNVSKTTLGLKTAGNILGPAISELTDAGIAVESYNKIKKDNKEAKHVNDVKDPLLLAKREIGEKAFGLGELVKNKAFPFPESYSDKKRKALGYKEGGEGVSGKFEQAGDRIIAQPLNKIKKLFGSEYAPKVAYIVDGDTIELDNGQRVRLIGVDTPEKGQPGYEDAKNRLSNMVLGKDVDVKFDVVSRDSTNTRLVADLIINGKNTGQVMIDEGLGTQMTVGANVGNVNDFAQRQNIAKETQQGRWGNNPKKIKLKTDGYGEPANAWQKFIKPDIGISKKDGYIPNNDQVVLRAQFGGKTQAEARKEVDKSMSEDDVLSLRGYADYYVESFQGGKKNQKKFSGTTLDEKMKNALEEDGSIKTKIAKLYQDNNYTEEEKVKLYKMMGFEPEEAQRAVLRIAKGKGMVKASPAIAQYIREQGFTKSTIDNLIDDGTLTKPQIDDLYDQDLITSEEHDILLGLQEKGGSKGESPSKAKKSVKSSSKSKRSLNIPKLTKGPSVKTIDYLSPFEGLVKFKAPTVPKAPSFKFAEQEKSEPFTPKFDKIKIKFK